ncbi:hypothetical protein G6F46_003740 [Rhizopus delemar]|uniref:Reverse transcriptase domain-containing protein n=2 Tax=Rhizopus TaxID=4842 RepID=A0A9P6YV08_9FUNG|nr:hypothetical protein G6F55_010111 [Rhizopus delemar]KAG1536883.1 hypothetical protein G6F51_010707 [Rhizopus arrhizus]KAG1490932.1 hypothetical protein G6F54_010373 [Rhizopus delemar]KAG1504124.1 hypothetical protein G6F53_010466 [Rhizopus delemar]KAG1520079.1 hypothetical protein G6F52_008006 [Rhizopus delemar]
MVINYVDADVEFLNPHWPDNILLQVTCKVGFVDNTGPGLWHANPIYTSNKGYRQRLDFMLMRLYYQEIANSILPPQDLWDLVKLKVKQFTKSFGKHYGDWRKQQILALQRKRQHLLRSSFPPALLATHLLRVEQQIQALQQKVTSITILKAERTYRERGEMDTGYLKLSAMARVVQRSITRLWDPDNGDICSSRTQMLDVTQKFYTKLHSPEPVCSSALDTMVSNIPSSCRLSKDDSEFIASSFLLDEILDQTSRSPKISSPGTDGLSYAFLKLIFKHPKYSDLIGRVYNDAIPSSLFPQSWLQTCVCLLSKKGDLTRLQNWRPITLIKCDAKIFTRLLNARMVTIIPPLISPWQTGFMKERFIADNGALAQIVIEQASLRNSDEIGLLCDQEKVYNRVHPTYLQAVLNRYGFPNNPLLFTLVLDPLVKNISDSPVIRGFGPPSLSLPIMRDPPYILSAIQPLKDLAYADDLILFLRDPTDLEATQQIIRCNNLASNAKMNFDKTIAFSVSGLSPHWPPVLASHGITKWRNR